MAPEGQWYLNSCFSTPVYFDLKCVSWVIKDSDLWSNSKSVLSEAWAEPVGTVRHTDIDQKLLKGCIAVSI